MFIISFLLIAAPAWGSAEEYEIFGVRSRSFFLDVQQAARSSISPSWSDFRASPGSPSAGVSFARNLNDRVKHLPEFRRELARLATPDATNDLVNTSSDIVQMESVFRAYCGSDERTFQTAFDAAFGDRSPSAVDAIFLGLARRLRGELKDAHASVLEDKIRRLTDTVAHLASERAGVEERLARVKANLNRNSASLLAPENPLNLVVAILYGDNRKRTITARKISQAEFQHDQTLLLGLANQVLTSPSERALALGKLREAEFRIRRTFPPNMASAIVQPALNSALSQLRLAKRALEDELAGLKKLSTRSEHLLTLETNEREELEMLERQLSSLRSRGSLDG